jgi:hypothetical protein
MLLLFTSLLHADDDMSSEKYCFSIPPQIARQKLSAIQVPSDVVSEDGNCLVVQMRPHRRELIQKYMLSAIPGASVNFSSAEIKSQPCKLKVEKEKTKITEQTDVALNQFPAAATTKIEKNGSEDIQIETLGAFELTVDQDQVKGNCRFIHSDRYEITLEVRKNLKPIIPVELPPGAIVIVNQVPTDQETSVLKTQVQLRRGEKIEVGSVLKKANVKDQQVEINPNLIIETESQHTSEKVFLSLF